MPTVEKIVNFNYVDVDRIILTKFNSNEDPIDFHRVVGSLNTWKCNERTSGKTYDCIKLFSGDEILAYIKNLEIDNLITNLYFKYNIVNSNISFKISDIQLDLDDQYIGDSGHNHNYIKVSNDTISNQNHFNNEGCTKKLKDTLPVTIEIQYLNNVIGFNNSENLSDELSHLPNLTMLLNTLTSYFNGDNLVLGCLYRSESNYYYYIKNSLPTGRNRLIKLSDPELVSDYEESKVFQLIEVFDNLVICTGKNLYTYNVQDANYLPELIDDQYTTRSYKDSIYSNNIFDLNSNAPIIKSCINNTIATKVPESQFAYYLPMDIDYCRKFFAIKLNSYNCYEFHNGNLLAGYNLDDEDKQVHHIHDGLNTGKSTLTYEEFKNDGKVEGTEYIEENLPTSLVNDTSPYTNYDSYSDTIETELNSIGELEHYLICELYLNLKHAINNVTGHGDLLGKFKYFRLLESGICKMTESMNGDLLLIIYSDVMDNIKKYIFKVGWANSIPIKFNEVTTEDIYIQLSNYKLSIYLRNKSGISYKRVIDLSTEVAGNWHITDGVINLEMNSVNGFVTMLYKNVEMNVNDLLKLENNGGNP